MIDIKAKVDEIVDKIKNDKSLADKFKKDPVAAVESVIGIDLPNDQLKNVVEAVKAKISIDKLGSIFGKK